MKPFEEMTKAENMKILAVKTKPNSQFKNLKK